MDSYSCIFNLMALIYQKLITFHIPEPIRNVEPAFEDNLVEPIGRLANEMVCNTRMSASEMMRIVIANYAEQYTEESYLFYRTLLTQLDRMVDMGWLIKKYGFTRPTYFDEDKTFRQMNDNRNETGVLILPKVVSPPVTFGVQGKDGMESKTGTDSNDWYDDINNHLNQIICISESKLNGFTLKNALLNIFDGSKKDISIGFAPGCNLHTEELMDVRKYTENHRLYFEIQGYKNPDYLTNLFCKSLDTAKKNHVDILIGSEMFGSQALADNTESYFNSDDDTSPKLIITPSFWNNRTNAASVYLNTGELVGRQFKQHPFYWKEKENGKILEYQERLDNTPKEILLLHIPHLGRMAIPICMDYLRTDYQDLLVKTLKVNWLLCPSYSPGTIPFADINSAMRSFGARSLWFDSCSALKTYSDSPYVIGLVSTSVRDAVCLNTASICVCPECQGTCHEGCVFAVKIRLESDDTQKNNNAVFCNSVEVTQLKSPI